MDGKGNALAVWTRDDDVRKVQWARWFDANTGTWGTAAPIEGEGTGDSKLAQIAVTPTGQAFAAWTRGETSVYASFCR